MKIFFARYITSSTDSGQTMRWFATESEARDWLKDRRGSITEDDVPSTDDVAAFLAWLNDVAGDD